MSAFIQLKRELKSVYSKYAIYINPFLKFLLALIVLLTINGKMGYMSRIDSLPLVIMAALFCSFMPLACIAFIEAAFILLHMYALNLEVALVTVLIMLLIFMVYLRFTPKETIVVLLTPIFFLLKIPYIMPIALGLIGGPASAVSVACGVILFYIIDYGNRNQELLAGLADETMVNRLKDVVDSMVGNKVMLVYAIGFAIVVVVVYLIRRLPIAHSLKVASAAGALTEIISMMVLIIRFRVSDQISMLGVIIGAIFAAIIGVALDLCILGLDYKRTENLQFEDDEYYYYVKAVPKMGVSTAKRKTSQEAKSAGKTVRTANGVRRTN